MRALCGAIIAAGAMIGLGLTALAYGIRFEGVLQTHEMLTLPPHAGPLEGITSMATCLVVLLLGLLIGLVVAFLGLMYHHERRHYELHGDAGRSMRSETAGRAL